MTKKCRYCKKQNEERNTHCAFCGRKFPVRNKKKKYLVMSDIHDTEFFEKQIVKATSAKEAFMKSKFYEDDLYIITNDVMEKVINGVWRFDEETGMYFTIVLLGDA